MVRGMAAGLACPSVAARRRRLVPDFLARSIERLDPALAACLAVYTVLAVTLFVRAIPVGLAVDGDEVRLRRLALHLTATLAFGVAALAIHASRDGAPVGSGGEGRAVVR